MTSTDHLGGVNLLGGRNGWLPLTRDRRTSSLPAGIEEDRVSAMSAAMLSLGERIASELGRGQLDQVYIRGDSGYVILMSVGEEAVLTTLVRENAKLGLIFLDMKRAADDLTKLV